MKTIPLTQGHVALVDDEDYEMLSRYKWRVRKYSHSDIMYAYRNFPVAVRKRGSVMMHRAITNAPKGMEVDHADGNALNNCRANLRVCTKHENQRNQRPQGGRSSALKGVSWHKRDKAWYANISINDKQTYLGKFLSEREAGMAYDRAAIAAYGEYARTNGLGG